MTNRLKRMTENKYSLNVILIPVILLLFCRHFLLKTWNSSLLSLWCIWQWFIQSIWRLQTAITLKTNPLKSFWKQLLNDSGYGYKHRNKQPFTVREISWQRTWNTNDYIFDFYRTNLYNHWSYFGLHLFDVNEKKKELTTIESRIEKSIETKNQAPRP